MKKGKYVSVGEQASQEELAGYSELSLHARRAALDEFRDPSLVNIKKSFMLEAVQTIQRHKYIHEVVRRTAKNHEFVFSEYGPGHSLLSHELEREGMKTSRRISPQIFGFYSEIIRRLVRGGKSRSHFRF